MGLVLRVPLGVLLRTAGGTWNMNQINGCCFNIGYEQLYNNSTVRKTNEYFLNTIY